MRPRHVRQEDCERVLAVIDEWWRGPTSSSYLPHVFFSHLTSTSFVLEAYDGVLVGFLLGFLSQVRPDEACVHMIGVHPAFRRLGFGRRLYERFFVAAQMSGRRYVRAISPPSGQSIAFHRAMGFVTLGGSSAVGDPSTREEPAGTGVPPVVFVRRIFPDAPALEASPAAVAASGADALCELEPKAPLDDHARALDCGRAGHHP